MNTEVKTSWGDGKKSDKVWDTLMSEVEQWYLKRLSRRKKCIEIGSFKGGSSVILSESGKCVVCIDPHDDQFWKDLGCDMPTNLHNVFLENTKSCKNLTYMQLTSGDALPHIRKNYYNFIFIDGDHSYDGCMFDLENYVPLLKKNSFVLVHDFSNLFSGVIAACMNYFKRLPNGLFDTLAVYYV